MQELRKRWRASSMALYGLLYDHFLGSHVVVIILHADGDGMLACRGVDGQLVIELGGIGDAGDRGDDRPVATVERVLRFYDVVQRVGGVPLHDQLCAIARGGEAGDLRGRVVDQERSAVETRGQGLTG